MCRRKTWSWVDGEWNGILFGVHADGFTFRSECLIMLDVQGMANLT